MSTSKPIKQLLIFYLLQACPYNLNHVTSLFVFLLDQTFQAENVSQTQLQIKTMTFNFCNMYTANQLIQQFVPETESIASEKELPVSFRSTQSRWDVSILSYCNFKLNYTINQLEPMDNRDGKRHFSLQNYPVITMHKRRQNSPIYFTDFSSFYQ